MPGIPLALRLSGRCLRIPDFGVTTMAGSFIGQPSMLSFDVLQDPNPDLALPV